MTPSDPVSYYGARAAEYERVYEKSERQADLRRLHDLVPAHFAGGRLLEVACGTGYWTRRLSARAASVTACDLSAEVLSLARERQPAGNVVSFLEADVYDLGSVPGTFDAAFVGFWWSHVPRRDLPRFLGGLHARVLPGSRVMVVDNRYVAGSSWPIVTIDAEGNRYQQRRLEDGTEHEVLKNFPTPDDVRGAIVAAGGVAVSVAELPYYWCATYEVGSA